MCKCLRALHQYDVLALKGAFRLGFCRYNAISFQPAPALPPSGISLWDPATQTNGCPSNSAPLQAASGRLLAVTDAQGWAATPQPALEPGVDVPHSHPFSASITLNSQSYAGIDGCCDDSPCPDGTVSMSGIASTDSTNLPYMSMLACNTTAPPKAMALPPGFVLLTVAGSACPAGWSPLNSSLAGRVVVAAPEFGVPGKIFGAAPIAGLDSTWAPAHTHTYQITVDTSPAGIMLDSGCCAGGYGHAGTYVTSGSVDVPTPGVAQFPLFIVQACMSN